MGYHDMSFDKAARCGFCNSRGCLLRRPGGMCDKRLAMVARFDARSRRNDGSNLIFDDWPMKDPKAREWILDGFVDAIQEHICSA